MRLQALFELLNQYVHVFRTSWLARKELTSLGRVEDERAFLPAALELQESPPHPAARITLWALMIFLLLTVCWAYWGKIDVVAVAPGKLIVSERSKIVQPLETGVVKAIHVQDGQYVQAGQILIELDSTINDAENTKNYTAWLDAKVEALRAQALLQALNKNGTPLLPSDPELPLHDVTCRTKLSDCQQQTVSQWQELQAKLSTIDADTSRKQAERAGTREQVHKLEQTLPFVTEKAADYKKLLSNAIVAKHDYQEKEQARIEAEQDLATLRRKLDELSEGLIANQRQKDTIVAEFRRTQHDTLVKAREKSQEMAQEVVKARQLHRQTQLVAPVSGLVQQLAVHTVGGVVTAAQALMVIVPREDAIEAEALLENKDIGFVKAGQEAAVKIETFNYTKYGLIDGTVQSVSLDAIQDEKRGLVYAVRLTLKKDRMDIEGKSVKLTPGMAITAEIKTTQRKVIEYFLSPLMQHVSESLRER